MSEDTERNQELEEDRKAVDTEEPDVEGHFETIEDKGYEVGDEDRGYEVGDE